MNIIIEKNAANFIKKHSKDDSVTLFIKSAGGGWCSVQSPTVQLGKPPIADNYEMYTVDDISVFIRRNTQTQNNKLHIFLRKFLWIKELSVDGMQINY